MFFGGDPIIPQLSSQSPPKTLIIIFFISASFQICLYCFKKIKQRKGFTISIASTQVITFTRKVFSQEQKLKEILVQNYLNLNKVIFITFTTIFILSYIFFHYFTIEANKNVTNVSELKGKGYLTPTGLWILAGFETFVQICPFYQSFALRKYGC